MQCNVKWCKVLYVTNVCMQFVYTYYVFFFPVRVCVSVCVFRVQYIVSRYVTLHNVNIQRSPSGIRLWLTSVTLILKLGELMPHRDVLVEIDSIPVAVLVLECAGGLLELHFPRDADHGQPPPIWRSFGKIIPGRINHDYSTPPKNAEE